MPTITSQLIQKARDSILIYEVGRGTQETNSKYANGISLFRLNKTLSAVLRHWELLRNSSKNYKSLNYWDILSAPFRYGQVVYKKVDPGNQNIINDYNVEFLQNIINNSYILNFFKVKIVVGNEFDAGKTKVVFPKAEPHIRGELIQASGLEYRDIEILRDLAFFYSHLQTDEVAALATCPTYFDCKKAINAEIVIWLHDLEKLFRLLKDYSGGDLSRANMINKRLSKAFECGRQIGKKIEWYLSLEKVQKNILKLTIDKDFSLSVIEPLSKNLIVNGETQELIDYKYISKILTGYIATVEHNVNLLSPSIFLPKDYSAKAKEFTSLLSEIKITNYELEELYLISGKRSLNSLIVLLETLEAIYNNKILTFMLTYNLPIKYDRLLLFPDLQS